MCVCVCVAGVEKTGERGPQQEVNAAAEEEEESNIYSHTHTPYMSYLMYNIF